MFQLCVADPVLINVTRLMLPALPTSTLNVLPIVSAVGASVMVGRDASWPLAVNRYGG